MSPRETLPMAEATDMGEGSVASPYLRPGRRSANGVVSPAVAARLQLFDSEGARS